MSRALHVLQVVPSYVPGTRYGGPIRSVHGLSSALVARGVRVSVLTTNRDEDVVLDVPTDRTLTVDGADVRYLATHGPARLRRAPGFTAAFRELAHDVDVVHVHGLFNAFSSAALAAARSSGLASVLSPRGMLMREPLARRGRVRKALWLRLVERSHLASLGAVHLTSALECDELPELGFDWPQLHVAPNGVEVPDACPDEALLAPEVRAVIGRPGLVLFLGRLNWKKGLDRVLEAAAIADERLHFVIAGPDDGWRDELLTRRARARLEARVTVLDSVSGADRAALLHAASLALLPSRSENFGNAVAESLALGCPAVVTRAVGAAELVEKYAAGAVVCEEPRALAEALERLILDPDARASAVAGAQRALATELGWDGVARGFEGLYVRVA